MYWLYVIFCFVLFNFKRSNSEINISLDTPGLDWTVHYLQLQLVLVLLLATAPRVQSPVDEGSLGADHTDLHTEPDIWVCSP